MLQQCSRTQHPEGQWGRALRILLYKNHVLKMLSSLSCHIQLGFKSRALTNRVKL